MCGDIVAVGPVRHRNRVSPVINTCAASKVEKSVRFCVKAMIHYRFRIRKPSTMFLAETSTTRPVSVSLIPDVGRAVDARTRISAQELF